MKKYNVGIHGTSNILGDNNYFDGTGFMGEGFDTREELVSLMRKYASYKKDGISYWRKEIKLNFTLGKTVEAFKKEGNSQCKENGYVNLFTAMLVCRKDPFYGIDVIYRPEGWVDKDGNVFKFVVIKGGIVTPKMGKLTDILRELGIEL